jgi:hypothetical protein
MSRTHPSLTVRPARLSEASDLHKLINESYRGTGGWTTEAHIIIGSRFTLEEIQALLSDPPTWENEPVFVAELNEPDEIGRRIVGCIQTSRGPPRPKSSLAKERIADAKAPHKEVRMHK